MFETKIFRDFVSFCFDAKLVSFGFVSFGIIFLCDEFCVVSKSKQFCFVMRSKPNRVRLEFFHVINMLYTGVALNTSSGHLSSSHEFSMEDDENILKYFKKKFHLDLLSYKG